MQQQPIRFGTDGWRAVIADQFTYDHVEIVASGISRYLLNHFSTEKPVVIGYDTRFMADRFAARAAEVLTSYGFSVLLTATYTPTPIVAFSAKYYDSVGALMFTASHNPPEYCGIKFIPHYAGPATPEITDELMANIHAIMQDNLPTRGTGGVPGTVDRFDPMERYVPYLSKQLNFDRMKQVGVKILYDSMHGAGQGYLDRIYLEKTGHVMEMIHRGTDPYFGGRIPEPKAAYLPELLEMVPQGHYDVGLANDGDADRFGVVDDQGRFLSANEVLPLLLRYLYRHRNFRGGVVRTLATSMLLDCVAKHYGIHVHETPVGFKYVGEWMRREDIIIGGEESGGLSILGHIPEKDGILATLLIVEMIATEGKPLSRIYQEMLDEIGVHLFQLSENLHLEEPQKQLIMDKLRKLSVGDTLAGKSITRIDCRDGVKLIFGDYDWMLVRPSGTEPILRLYGESSDNQQLSEFRRAVESMVPAPQIVH